MENHIEAEETKQDKGFTLVELLIVIVILGILATVTVFAVTGITNKGKTSACNADLKVLQTAEEANNANTGVYADQPTLKANGLLHAVSPNFTFATTGSGATATYTLTGVDNSATGGNNCFGING
jgi:general secretion pathway protein G